MQYLVFYYFLNVNKTNKLKIRSFINNTTIKAYFVTFKILNKNFNPKNTLKKEVAHRVSQRLLLVLLLAIVPFPFSLLDRRKPVAKTLCPAQPLAVDLVGPLLQRLLPRHRHLHLHGVSAEGVVVQGAWWNEEGTTSHRHRPVIASSSSSRFTTTTKWARVEVWGNVGKPCFIIFFFDDGWCVIFRYVQF